jgi:osmotically-inducible protein OsmY
LKKGPENVRSPTLAVIVPVCPPSSLVQSNGTGAPVCATPSPVPLAVCCVAQAASASTQATDAPRSRAQQIEQTRIPLAQRASRNVAVRRVDMVLRDEDIQRSVLQEFKWDARIRPTEIGVTVKDGVVTLVGTVESYTKKWTAEEIALRVAGVKAVVNKLEVKLAAASERSDEDIAKAARQTLEYSWDIPDTVKLTVDQGWITLHGEVEWNYQREAAEQKVRDITGVKGVLNQIIVKPKTNPEDVKRRIEEALVRAAETDAKNIKVDVQDGRVILKGRVHSWYEKEEAKREAWLAPGVREVVDQLMVTL